MHTASLGLFLALFCTATIGLSRAAATVDNNTMMDRQEGALVGAMIGSAFAYPFCYGGQSLEGLDGKGVNDANIDYFEFANLPGKAVTLREKGWWPDGGAVALALAASWGAGLPYATVGRVYRENYMRLPGSTGSTFDDWHGTKAAFEKQTGDMPAEMTDPVINAEPAMATTLMFLPALVCLRGNAGRERMVKRAEDIASIIYNNKEGQVLAQFMAAVASQFVSTNDHVLTTAGLEAAALDLKDHKTVRWLIDAFGSGRNARAEGDGQGEAARACLLVLRRFARPESFSVGLVSIVKEAAQEDPKVASLAALLYGMLSGACVGRKGLPRKLVDGLYSSSRVVSIAEYLSHDQNMKYWPDDLEFELPHLPLRSLPHVVVLDRVLGSWMGGPVVEALHEEGMGGRKEPLAKWSFATAQALAHAAALIKDHYRLHSTTIMEQFSAVATAPSAHERLAYSSPSLSTEAPAISKKSLAASQRRKLWQTRKNEWARSLFERKTEFFARSRLLRDRGFGCIVAGPIAVLASESSKQAGQMAAAIATTLYGGLGREPHIASRFAEALWGAAWEGRSLAEIQTMIDRPQLGLHKRHTSQDPLDLLLSVIVHVIQDIARPNIREALSTMLRTLEKEIPDLGLDERRFAAYGLGAFVGAFMGEMAITGEIPDGRLFAMPYLNLVGTTVLQRSPPPASILSRGSGTGYLLKNLEAPYIPLWAIRLPLVPEGYASADAEDSRRLGSWMGSALGAALGKALVVNQPVVQDTLQRNQPTKPSIVLENGLALVSAETIFLQKQSSPIDDTGDLNRALHKLCNWPNFLGYEFKKLAAGSICDSGAVQNDDGRRFAFSLLPGFVAGMHGETRESDSLLFVEAALKALLKSGPSLDEEDRRYSKSALLLARKLLRTRFDELDAAMSVLPEGLLKEEKSLSELSGSPVPIIFSLAVHGLLKKDFAQGVLEMAVRIWELNLDSSLIVPTAQLYGMLFGALHGVQGLPSKQFETMAFSPYIQRIGELLVYPGSAFWVKGQGIGPEIAILTYVN